MWKLSRRTPASRRRLVIPLAAIAWLTALPGAVGAESALRFPAPEIYETVPAATYDDAGRRVGRAHLAIEKLENGNVRILSDSGYENGARTVATAELEPVTVDGGQVLVLVRQTSESVFPDGSKLGRLEIDHRERKGRCTTPRLAGGETVEEIELPDDDRVVNVPLNLLFLPLVNGETDTLSFQLFLCRETPHFLEFEARVTGRGNGAEGPALVEVRYTPDLGGMLSILAQGFIPNLSFWFDPEAANPYVAHRMPLYSSGPEITVLRDGVPFPELTLEN